MRSCRRGAARTVGPPNRRPRAAGSATARRQAAGRAGISGDRSRRGSAFAPSTASGCRSAATRFGRAGRTARWRPRNARPTGCRNPAPRRRHRPPARPCSKLRRNRRSVGYGSRSTPRRA